MGILEKIILGIFEAAVNPYTLPQIGHIKVVAKK